MSLRKKIFFSHSLFFIFIASAFIWPALFYYFVLIFNGLFILLGALVFKKNLIARKNFIFLLLPFLFFNSLIFFLSTLIPSLYFIFPVLIASLLSYYYCLNLRQESNNLLVLSDALSLLSVFLASSFFYNLNHFMNINLIWVFLCLVLFLILLAGLNIYLLTRQKPLLGFFLAVLLLALSPLVWAFFFLPFNYSIIALLLSLFYYAGLSFIRLYLKQNLGPRKVKYNLIFIVSLLILILISIKWR